MISDFETNTIYLSEKLKLDYPYVYNQIENELNSDGLELKLLYNTRDVWSRDYMPIQVREEKFIEYRYDPDYLQGTIKERREIKTYPDIVCDSIGISTVKSDIILDGGNVVKSKNKVILTDKVVIENQYHYSKMQLVEKLEELFEVDKVILIPRDKGCLYGHADGMLRFIDNDTVLISGFYYHNDKKLKEGIVDSLRNANIKFEWLICSNRKEGPSSVNYINFLQTKDIILVPKLNINEDDTSCIRIGHYFPDYYSANRIKQIDTTEISKKGGALNCISWTIKQ